MKAYLITMVILRVIDIVGPQRGDPSDTEIALTQILRIGLLAWTIYLLCQL